MIQWYFSGIKESKIGAHALPQRQDWNDNYCRLQALRMASKDVASSYNSLHWQMPGTKTNGREIWTKFVWYEKLWFNVSVVFICSPPQRVQLNRPFLLAEIRLDGSIGYDSWRTRLNSWAHLASKPPFLQNNQEKNFLYVNCKICNKEYQWVPRRKKGHCPSQKLWCQKGSQNDH